jgi:hypothetical protein
MGERIIFNPMDKTKMCRMIQGHLLRLLVAMKKEAKLSITDHNIS